MLDDLRRMAVSFFYSVAQPISGRLGRDVIALAALLGHVTTASGLVVGRPCAPGDGCSAIVYALPFDRNGGLVSAARLYVLVYRTPKVGARIAYGRYRSLPRFEHRSARYAYRRSSVAVSCGAEGADFRCSRARGLRALPALLPVLHRAGAHRGHTSLHEPPFQHLVTIPIGIFPTLGAFCKVCFLPSWCWNKATERLRPRYGRVHRVLHALWANRRPRVPAWPRTEYPSPRGHGSRNR
jgi:hypothetical protein